MISKKYTSRYTLWKSWKKWFTMVRQNLSKLTMHTSDSRKCQSISRLLCRRRENNSMHILHTNRILFIDKRRNHEPRRQCRAEEAHSNCKFAYRGRRHFICSCTELQTSQTQSSRTRFESQSWQKNLRSSCLNMLNVVDDASKRGL